MRRRLAAPASMLALVLLLAACASTYVRAERGAHWSERPTRVLTAKQLERFPRTMTLFDVIMLDRTLMLQGRYAGALVYVDGQPFGEAAALRAISITAVREVRLLTATEAAMRYGTTKGIRSVIDVVTAATIRR